MDRPGRPIRLWFNGLHAKSGGGLTYMNNMVPYLAQDRRFDLRVVLSPGVQAPGGVEAIYPPAWVSKLRSVAAEQIWLPYVAGKAGADLIYSPANFGPLWGPPEILLLSNSIRAQEGAARWSLRALWFAYSVATKLSLRRCRGAIAVSDSIRAELATKRMAGAIPVIHHGVSKRFTPCGEPRQDFLLAVGDVYVQKNFHTLIEAFATVQARYPHMHLRIAGRSIDRDYRQRLDALAVRYGVAEKVHFLGSVPVETLLGLYRGCRVFVFPSMAESFGLPILEAMACGAPTVIADCSAMPEVAGGAGLLADAASPDALAKSVLQVLGDDALAERLSAAGLIRVQSKGWEDTARQTADFLALMA